MGGGGQVMSHLVHDSAHAATMYFLGNRQVDSPTLSLLWDRLLFPGDGM